MPELVPIRYGRMLASPFAFFRGAADVMAHDLAATPRSGFDVQCCGDAHLSNFGVFASPERRLVFDINDFDETLSGPWEWDVKRLAASVLIASRDNGHSPKRQRAAVLACVAQYRTTMRDMAAMENLAVWYARLDTEDVMVRNASQLEPTKVSAARAQPDRARGRDSLQALRKLTEVHDGQPRIVDQAPLIVPLRVLASGARREQVTRSLNELMRAYAETLEPDRRALLDQFRLADFARKVVGVGSVGAQAWIALLLGHDGTEPLFLQLKEAGSSVLEAQLGPSPYANHGRRVVSGQRLMQATGDALLGWVHVAQDVDGRSRDYYARQLRDWKGSAHVDQMSATDLATYGRLCGWTLARAHARTGDRVAIAAYLGRGESFDRALVQFATAYADLNERDHARLGEAVAAGEIIAETGV